MRTLYFMKHWPSGFKRSRSYWGLIIARDNLYLANKPVPFKDFRK